MDNICRYCKHELITLTTAAYERRTFHKLGNAAHWAIQGCVKCRKLFPEKHEQWLQLAGPINPIIHQSKLQQHYRERLRLFMKSP